VKDHVALHGLEYTVKTNGGIKTEKTEDNTLKFMRSIADMPNRKNVQWFDDDIYQDGTERGYSAVHIYDLEKRVIAIFKKSTGKFVTTCQLNREKDNELLRIGNLGGDVGLVSEQFKNLPPVTQVNSFEIDIMGVTPIDES